jgi:beta-phosphoglucomutase-like phosphatase (HAD superfamily)
MSFFCGKFKAVIFDLDGVIIDSEPIHLEVLNEICRQWGKPHTMNDYAQYQGRTDIEIWGMVKKRYNAEFDVEEMVRFYNKKLTEYYRNTDNVSIVKGIPELLSVLRHEGILCAIGSASSRVNIDLTLEHTKNKDYFCQVSAAMMLSMANLRRIFI